ncbi:MAG TPA: TIGR01777 family oxidoreductase [Pyrinomonadaceae bacterium]|nr:TIGR01777 family oxidoreductase [Pyrinomonadaceae bacterium]
MAETFDMKILITGSTGLVGTALARSLKAKGHEVVRLVRHKTNEGGTEVFWDPEQGTLDPAELEGIDAAVHLAGENLAEGKWTEEKKRRIRESRVKGTRLLSETLAKLKRQPRVLVSASAVGFYGDRGDELLNEQSASGSDFLAEVCREWELATQPAAQAGVRVVNLRFGVIFSGEGGALKKMLLPFKLGVGGSLGGGEQYMSWITLDDAVGAIVFALENETLRGPVNAVAPSAATNREFTKALGGALSRPTIFPIPSFAARLVFGEMADATLLSSQRVEPQRLKEAGYIFKYPELKGALKHVLA